MPLVAINTTAGTASEMTRFCIITNGQTHIKMAIVDQNVTPAIAINDPDLTEQGVKAEDIPEMAINALKDTCAATNPGQGTQAEVEQIFKNAL